MTGITTLASTVAASCAACVVTAVVLLGVSGTAAAPRRAAPANPKQLQRLTGAVPESGPGPLEQRARPVTPESPVPARIHYVAPAYPADAAAIEAAATVVVRLTIDAAGRVAEVR